MTHTLIRSNSAGNRVRAAFSAFVALLLAGCASESNLLRGPAPADLRGQGAVLISIGHTGDKSPFQAYWIEAESTDNPATTIYLSSSPENIFNDGKRAVSSKVGKGDLIAFKLPPGTYKVTRMGAFSDHGPISPTITWKASDTFEFALRQDEITYLGFAVFGRRGPGRAVAYFVFDEFERDVGLLRSIRPELGGVPVRRNLLGPEMRN